MRQIAVVVPAHDESLLLPGCLAALRAAAAGAAPLPVRLIVVADACTDDTTLVAAAGGAEVVTITERNVGRARAAGVAYAMSAVTGPVWLATTDADSRVRPGWLRWQLAHARRGAALVAGTVEVDDWSAWPGPMPSRYERRYRELVAGVRHGHIHGANLGFTAGAYVAAGGFPALRCDEDRELVARVRASGGRVVTDATCPVRTSGRPDGRAPNGFAAHLLSLAAEN
ncbi:glycosyltransferase [Actinoplanes sp. NPDC026619]|uniref:glycosyltransferase n=1 Tax=Actinoplanes sp. NPDC026619 TaxID=3155798 RepID=UPI0033F2767C